MTLPAMRTISKRPFSNVRVSSGASKRLRMVASMRRIVPRRSRAGSAAGEGLGKDVLDHGARHPLGAGDDVLRSARASAAHAQRAVGGHQAELDARFGPAPAAEAVATVG